MDDLRVWVPIASHYSRSMFDFRCSLVLAGRHYCSATTHSVGSAHSTFPHANGGGFAVSGHCLARFWDRLNFDGVHDVWKSHVERANARQCPDKMVLGSEKYPVSFKKLGYYR